MQVTLRGLLFGKVLATVRLYSLLHNFFRVVSGPEPNDDCKPDNHCYFLKEAPEIHTKKGDMLLSEEEKNECQQTVCPEKDIQAYF